MIEGRAVAPAAELWSTAEDLCRWAAFIADPDAAVLSRETVEEMSTFQSMVDLTKWRLAYGLGFAAVPERRRRLRRSRRCPRRLPGPRLGVPAEADGRSGAHERRRRRDDLGPRDRALPCGRRGIPTGEGRVAAGRGGAARARGRAGPVVLRGPPDRLLVPRRTTSSPSSRGPGWISAARCTSRRARISTGSPGDTSAASSSGSPGTMTVSPSSSTSRPIRSRASRRPSA